ncbi:MAG: R3H domain-containing nucleic acid-binding protein [Myxococcota bacterium]
MARETFEGRSAAEAAIKACERLGVSRSQLKYDVVSEDGEGLDRRVVIAVDVTAAPSPASMPTADEIDDDDFVDDEEPPRRDEVPDRADRGDRGSRGGARGRGGRSRRGRSGNGRETRSRRGRGDRDRDSRDRGRNSGRGRSRRGQTRRGPDDEGIDALLNLEVLPPEDYEPRAAVDSDPSPRGALALTVIAELLQHLGFEMEKFRVQDDEEEIHFDLRGDSLEKLIGKKGEPLLALQFLVNRIVDRGEEEGEQHIVLDAAGYRHRRRTALAELATKLAERAKEEGKVVRLSPMSAHDRRIFHITLQELDGISTRSQGGGLYRPLLIIPDVEDADDGMDDEDDED